MDSTVICSFCAGFAVALVAGLIVWMACALYNAEREISNLKRQLSDKEAE